MSFPDRGPPETPKTPAQRLLKKLGEGETTGARRKAAEMETAKQAAQRKMERTMYPDTKSLKGTSALNEAADKILASNGMHDSQMWIDLRGDIRKIIDGGYERGDLDRQVKLTKAKYNDLKREAAAQEQDERESKQSEVVDASTLSTDLKPARLKRKWPQRKKQVVQCQWTTPTQGRKMQLQHMCGFLRVQNRN